LAQAIPELKVELQKTARAILADRFYCLPAKKLSEKLGDQDPTVRRAAVTVCRQRKLKTLAPQLIEMLDDRNEDVAKQVHEVLQQFASRDFGPKRGADHIQRQEAMAAWRDWWEQQEKQTAANRRRS
jgi:HEAT repeat protein